MSGPHSSGLTELRFERQLDAKPDEAWRWLTEPALMNRWSEAHIEHATEHRRTVRVRAFGLTSRLDEEILERDPPRRFVYRVVRHPTIRDHRGIIELVPRGPGSTLRWTVRFRGVLPGMAAMLSAVLRPSLDRSLDLLVAQVGR